ncbi:MAG: hypothetical protein ABFD97_22345 [Syntrophobacter sp.]
MDDHTPRHLRIIGQLAQEYEQKYKQLDILVSGRPREEAIVQLRALAERTTDRFRAAQMALLTTPGLFEQESGESALRAVTALCSAFDELRILFQFLRESIPEENAPE